MRGQPEGGFQKHEVSNGSRGADRARGACVHRHGYRRDRAERVQGRRRREAARRAEAPGLRHHWRATGAAASRSSPRRSQVSKLRGKGLKAKLLRDRRGRTARRAAAAQAAGGWQVWRPYARTDVELSGAAGNPTDNFVTQLKKIAKRYDKITELVTIGRTLNDVPIYALRITKNADKTPDGRRPAVLYSATQHAREWLAGETNRRTLRMFVDNYGERGTAVGTDGQPIEGVSARELTRLVDTRELWFVPVANPDGYDFTFTPENRLWRKNLRDNNGDGEITAIDGVDLNRNFPTRWPYDDEGSNRELSSETYHGTGPASEPEIARLPLADEPGPLHVQQERPHLRAAAAVAARLAGRHPFRRRGGLRDARRQRRQPGDPRRSTRTSAPTSTRRTATRTTTCTRPIASSRSPRRAPAERALAAGSSSRTSRRTCSSSSSGTCSSRSTSPARRTIPTTRSATSATRRLTSRWTASTCRSATRRRSRSTRAVTSAASRCTTA